MAQSEKRREKRRISGQQNPFPSSQKLTKHSLKTNSVYRTDKFK